MFKCNYCGKVGHKAAVCKKIMYDLTNKNSKTANAVGESEYDMNSGVAVTHRKETELYELSFKKIVSGNFIA